MHLLKNNSWEDDMKKKNFEKKGTFQEKKLLQLPKDESEEDTLKYNV